MKTCVTCKHLKQGLSDFFRPSNDSLYAKCASPRNGVNLVTGEPKVVYADRARASYGGCGHAGYYWEAK